MSWFRRRSPDHGGPSSTARLDHALGSSPYEDRCIGCLLGAAAGDILGANVEFQSRDEIRRRHGRVHSFLDSEARPLGMFTDDTEMTLALAVSLIERHGLDPGHCAATYARFFTAEPRRGYGPAVSKVLAMLAAGSDYRHTGRAIYPEGSFANGGAMRIAPVGLAFRSAGDAVLHRAVASALVCTHVHPDAVDGAFIQARAVSALVRTEDPAGLDVARFLSELVALAETPAMKQKFRIVIEARHHGWPAEKMLDAVCTPNEYGKQFQIHAAEAVACALWAFAGSPQDPEACVIEAVCLGGDTDTVGTMTGALAGALHGSAWLPRRWFDPMENDPSIGRDYLIELARQLAKLALTSVL